MGTVLWPRALEQNLDRSTKIDTTYPLVKKIHVFALGLVSFFKGGLRGKIVIPCIKNKNKKGQNPQSLKTLLPFSIEP